MNELENILGVNRNMLGHIMKTAVIKAMNAIRQERYVFTSETKASETGKARDIVTSADLKAQEIYLNVFRKLLPDFGIIAEEEKFRRPHATKRKVYITIDPLDGSDGFERGQSFGVSTMIAVAVEIEIVAAFVGDINTDEIFFLWPGSDVVELLDNGSARMEKRRLAIDPNRPLKGQYILLRKPPNRYSEVSRKIIALDTAKPLFKSLNVIGGSIGLSFSQLWKGVFGALLLGTSYETPWDSAPVIGISKKMGFKFFALDPYDPKNIREINPKPIEKIYKRDYEILVIHESRKREFLDWARKNL
ncbi:MAG: inositol monophosphatase family protein [Candidatus Falkowbacteria bacterium]